VKGENTQISSLVACSIHLANGIEEEGPPDDAVNLCLRKFPWIILQFRKAEGASIATKLVAKLELVLKPELVKEL
jgi:hypothetical protein